MTKAEAIKVAEEIRLWSPLDQAWWRNLIVKNPKEAAVIADLILLGARPTDAL